MGRGIIGWAALWLFAGPAHAFVREAFISQEVRFAGAPAEQWRMLRPTTELRAPATDEWRAAESVSGKRLVHVSRRVVVGVRPGSDMPWEDARALGLEPTQRVRDDLWIFTARDVWTAARAADSLSRLPEVEVAVPVLRRPLAQHAIMAPRPADPYFFGQWHLENRNLQGYPLGPDLNPREAWAFTRGEGVTIAIVDDGFEVDHPDLRESAVASGHYDFIAGVAGPAVYGPHGTCVAGVAAARGDNHIGIAGVAPAAGIASWTIFDKRGAIVDDQRLMNMFLYRNQEIAVQNHSWGNGNIIQSGPSALEAAALTRVFDEGRGGKGVVIVRSGGNGREASADTNDDGYANDPRVIAVAAARLDGRATSYSSPGACLLVAGLSGDATNFISPTVSILTTDRRGLDGYNRGSYLDDRADYALPSSGFSGTSAAAPQVAGIAAMILSVNPDLSYRDVQQILIHSARHHDAEDPGIRTNGAGYRVSHNQGFGIPDAGQAVRLARSWKPRPPISVGRWQNQRAVEVPDDGLRLWVSGPNEPEKAIRSRASLGPHPDEPTEALPLVFVGLATNDLPMDLTGRGALIQRGGTLFARKIEFAAKAGAAFAVLFNDRDGDRILTMDATDYVPIPAIAIGENDGRALVARLEGDGRVVGQIRLQSVSHEFRVTTPMLCEHVGLRVRANHGARGDLRITLVSPSGTRSVLQRWNQDTEPGPNNWTYWSVHHFGESSVGEWKAWFSDQEPGTTGRILESELIIRGVPIADTDADGLDDRWESEHFLGLSSGPRDDPDRDGWTNAQEQILGTDPLRRETSLELDLSHLNENTLRVSWPSTPLHRYRVFSGETWDSLQEVGQVQTDAPSAEWLTPLREGPRRFFKIQETER